MELVEAKKVMICFLTYWPHSQDMKTQYLEFQAGPVIMNLLA